MWCRTLSEGMKTDGLLGFPKAAFAGREGRTFSLYLKNEEATESE